MKKYFVLLVILSASFYSALAQTVEPDTVWTLNLLPDGPVNCVKFFPDGTKFVNNAGSYVQIRETATGKLLKQFVHQSPEILSIDVSKDGKYVFASGKNTYYIGMWDVETGIERKFKDDIGYSGVYSLSISPDNKKIVATLFNGGNRHSAIIIWDIETGKVDHKIDELYGDWRKIKYFNNSNKFVVVKAGKPWQVFIYDADSFKKITELEFHYKVQLNEIPDMDISKDDKYLAVINNVSSPDTSNVKIWNLKDYSLVMSNNYGPIELWSVKISDGMNNIYVSYVFVDSVKIFRSKMINTDKFITYDLAKYRKKCWCSPVKIDVFENIVSHNEYIIYGGLTGLALFYNTNTDVIERDIAVKDQEEVFPNPTSGQINIKVNLQVADVLQISIFKLNGQRVDFSYVKQFDVGQIAIPINVGFLDKGFYIIKVEGKNIAKSFKLVKE
jgi:hypothetical protein